MFFAVLLRIAVLVDVLGTTSVAGTFIPARKHLARKDLSSSPTSGGPPSIWTSNPSTSRTASRSDSTLSSSVVAAIGLHLALSTSSSGVVSTKASTSNPGTSQSSIPPATLAIDPSEDESSRSSGTTSGESSTKPPSAAALPPGKPPVVPASYPRESASNSVSTIPAVIVPPGPLITPTATLPTNTTTTASLWSTSWFTFSIATCPTTFAPDAAIQYQTGLPVCEMVQLESDWKLDEYADVCLRQYCEYQYTSLMYDFVSLTQTGGPRYATRTKVQYSGLYSSGSTTTKVTALSIWTTTFTVPLDAFAAVSTVKSPCCGTCYLSAETIQLFWWPPATDQMTATPVITALPLNATASITNLPIVGDGTYIDESGFTFVSPSVYIAFTSLGGHNSCGLLGEPIYNTTIGFHRNEISSLVSPEPFTVCTTTHKQLVKSYTWEWTDTDTSTTTVYTILTQKVEYTDVAQDCSSIPGYSFFADNPQNWQIALGDPCHPVIAIPERVKNLRPEWASCGGRGQRGGFFDPPSTLHQGFHLVPTTASPGPGTPTLPPETIEPTVSPPLETLDPPASQPDPAPSHPEETPEPASSNGPQQQPTPPKGGSTTTIVIVPPPSKPTKNDSKPPVTPPPVLTLKPPSDPGNPANTGGEVVTLVPTIIPPSNTRAVPQDPNQPTPSQPPHTFGPGSSTTAVIIGTQTLLQGSTITVGGSTSTLANEQTTVVGGTQVVLDPGGTQIIVGGSSTINIPTPVQPTAPIRATVGTNLITANSDGTLLIGSQTLVLGGVITVDGTTISLAPDASQLVVDGSTIPLTATAAAAAKPAAGPLVLTLGAQTLTANPLSQFMLADGQTLIPGGPPLTISGTTISLAPDPSTVLINGTPIPLYHAQATDIAPLVVTIGDQMLTADALTHFTIGDKTLSFGGPALTVHGTTYLMTTNEEGSTVLLAGTAGSSVLVASERTTTTAAGRGATSVSSEVAEESPTGRATATSKKSAGARIGVELWGVGVGVVAGAVVFAYGLK